MYHFVCKLSNCSFQLRQPYFPKVSGFLFCFVNFFICIFHLFYKLLHSNQLTNQNTIQLVQEASHSDICPEPNTTSQQTLYSQNSDSEATELHLRSMLSLSTIFLFLIHRESRESYGRVNTRGGRRCYTTPTFNTCVCVGGGLLVCPGCPELK